MTKTKTTKRKTQIKSAAKTESSSTPESEGPHLRQPAMETSEAASLALMNTDSEAVTIDSPMEMQQRPVNHFSLEALQELGWDSVTLEMHKEHTNMVMYYMSDTGGGMSVEEAIKRALVFHDERATEEEVDRIRRQPISFTSWYSLRKLFWRSPTEAENMWHEMKREARNEFESGHRAGNALEPLEWMREAWNRARYLGIRESFIEQWKPQGGIDLAMIDMLTQSFHFYLYWTEKTALRTEDEMRDDPPEWVQAEARYRRNMPRDRSEMRGGWNPVYASRQEAVEHASVMADRYAKAFQRNLRAMRDLRRYSPAVTINNPQQVNIAADGGQQINLAKED